MNIEVGKATVNSGVELDEHWSYQYKLMVLTLFLVISVCLCISGFLSSVLQLLRGKYSLTHSLTLTLPLKGTQVPWRNG